jgi:ProP effector
VHTRSTRYLQSVAAGTMRHDLSGAAVEPLAAEHIYLAIMELYRRRQGRSKVDLKPQLLAQLTQAFEVSGLGREEYASKVHVNLAETDVPLCEAFSLLDAALAKDTALLRAYQQSGKTPEAFAEMYGLQPADVQRVLARESSEK